jgi:hypothetical protein
MERKRGKKEEHFFVDISSTLSPTRLALARQTRN